MKYLAAGLMVAAALGFSIPAAPASAATYMFSFQNDASSANYSAYGSVLVSGLFTAGNVLPSAITGISGTVSGGNVLDGNIIGLSPYAASDNILLATGTSGDYSFGGVSFTVSNGSQTADYNLYDWNGSTFLLFSQVDPTGYAQNGTPSGSLNPSIIPSVVTPVPEPAIWAMLLLGFGLAGFMMRGRQRFLGAAA